MHRIATLPILGLTLTALLLGTGCATTSESGEVNSLTKNVGKNYPPKPAGLPRVKVGIPNFTISKKAVKAGQSKNSLATLAADILTTLAVKTRRYRVIERAQLDQLLKEQGLEGVVDPNELAQPGKVKGVDYLMIGKITNFRIKQTQSRTGFGLGQLTGRLLNVGAVDVKKNNMILTVDVGVDIRFVNPTTGDVVATAHSDYKKQDRCDAFGLQLLGANATAEGNMSISEDDQGIVLRLALDNAIREILPDMDDFLLDMAADAKEAEAKKAKAVK